MNSQVIKFIVVLAFFLGLMAVFIFALNNDPTKLQSQLIDKPSPQFLVKSLLDENREYSQEIFKGKITLLNFWASWCRECYADHAYWDTFVKSGKSKSEGIELVGLNYKDTKEKAFVFLKNQGNPYKDILFDHNGRLGIEFGVYGIPETFIIDMQGKVRFRYAGAVTPEIFASQFEPIIVKIKKGF